MTVLEKVKSKFVHAKVFIQRAMTYATIANSMLIIFLFLSSLEKYGIDLKLDKWYPLIILITPFILIFIGYVEDRLGLFRLEHRVTASRNRYFVEIDKKLDYVIKEIEELKNDRPK